MSPLSSIARAVLDILFPPRCAGCKKVGRALCGACAGRLTPAHDIAASWYSAGYSYGDRLVRTILTNLKFRHKKEAARELCSRAADSLIDFLQEKIATTEESRIILIPIPAHTAHKISRGFNQAQLIAQLFSKYIPESQVSTMLGRVQKTAPQSSLKTKSARLRNMEGALTASAPPASNCTAIIIDDIITTGATLEAARTALKAAGWKTVYGFAVAYTPLHENK